MNYIYDILANFNDVYYDFFDWNESDNIIHIKKVPIIKVSNDFFNNVKFNDVFVDNKLIEKIYHKTDFFKTNKNKYGYVCILCDGNEAIIVNFSSKGSVLGRSSLLIDEENEVIDISEVIDVSDYGIVVKENYSCDFFKTRRESSFVNMFLQELRIMDNDKLKYLYFECFDEREDDINIINDRIISELKNNFEAIYSKIYSFLKLISFNK